MIVELTKTATLVRRDALEHHPGHDQRRDAVRHPDRHPAVSGRFFDVEDFLYRLESYVRFQNTTFSVTGRLIQVTNVSLTGGATTTTTTTTGTAPLTVAVTLNAYLWGGAVAHDGAGDDWGGCAQ